LGFCFFCNYISFVITLQQRFKRMQESPPHCLKTWLSAYSATSLFVAFLANLPHGSAWLHDGQVLADHGTWSNPQLQALVQTHARLIQEYRCVEWQSQGPSPAAPVVDQGPQVNSPLLIPPLNQLAQLRAARAHGENAENAQEEAAQGLRMLDQRRITAAIMKLWAPHV